MACKLSFLASSRYPLPRCMKIYSRLMCGWLPVIWGLIARQMRSWVVQREHLVVGGDIVQVLAGCEMLYPVSLCVPVLPSRRMWVMV